MKKIVVYFLLFGIMLFGVIVFVEVVMVVFDSE